MILMRLVVSWRGQRAGEVIDRTKRTLEKRKFGQGIAVKNQ